MTNLSDYFTNNSIVVPTYTPVMMTYDGAGGVTVSSKANTTNLLTFVCTIQANKTAGSTSRAAFNAGAGSGSPLLLFAYDTSHATVDLRDRISFDVRNTAGTKLVHLSPNVDILDGNKHTVLFAYDANNGTAVLFVDGVNADDTVWASRVAPIVGTIPTAGQVWRAGLAWWASSNYFFGNLGFLGYHGIYLTDPTIFFDENNVERRLNETTWSEWGGAQPFIWNEHGDIRNNKGSFGVFGGLGNRQNVTDESE